MALTIEVSLETCISGGIKANFCSSKLSRTNLAFFTEASETLVTHCPDTGDALLSISSAVSKACITIASRANCPWPYLKFHADCHHQQ